MNDEKGRTPQSQSARDEDERLRSIVTAMAEGVVLQAADGTILDWNAAVHREKEILLESVDVGIALTVDRKIVWMNRRVEEMSLYTRDELVGHSIRVLYPSEEAYLAAAPAIAAAHAKGEVFETELPLRRKDGSLAWIQTQGRVLDPQHPERGTLWVVTDRTAERRVHEALRRERERYVSLMRIAQDGIHLVDETGTLVEANPAFLRMLGRGPEAIGTLRVSDWDARIAAELVDSAVRAVLARPGLFETRHRRADGSTLDVEVHAGGVELEGQRFVLASSRDITARKELERQLALKQAQLEELNASLEQRVKEAVDELRAKDQLLVTQSRHAAMGEMIGNIAHQWRQPLNALGLVLSNLRDASRFGELTAADVEEAVADGHRLVQKMSSTINDFRDFFRPEKERHPFSALAQIEETVRLVDASFRSVGIAIVIEAASDLRLLGHANEYSQVLLNVLANARQAIQGSNVANGRVVIRLAEQDGWGLLTVRDNGGGIPEAILDKVFDPYFSTKDSGTGIGLYMSRQIVERSLGGTVTAKNVAGGAELTVRVPLAAPG